MNDLIKRIDYEVESWDTCDKSTLLRDCRAEIQRLLTANEALKGLCDEYQAEVKQLEVNHEFSKVINLGLRSQNESLDAECARLEALREYVPMTDDELFKLHASKSAVSRELMYDSRWVEAEVIKRAGLRIKDKP